MAASINNYTQLAVIGAGPGGYAAAFLAADLGIQVTLIDLDPNPGGVCLYRGCIPSKTFLHVAKVLKEARELDKFGVVVPEAKIDIDKMRSWKDQVVRKMTGGLGELSKRRGIEFIRGRAKLRDSNTLTIEKHEGGQQEIRFRHAILATGSRPVTLPILPTDHPRILDSTSALEIQAVPKTMLTIGGGYIGLELGTVYSALGSEVTIVEMTSDLLPGADRDLVNILARGLKQSLHSIRPNTRVVDAGEQKSGMRVRFRHDNGEESEDVFEKVLVSVGRRPNTEGLGLEKTKVELDRRGFVQTDGQQRTADPSILAIGDVAGEPMLAHKATHEGYVAAEVVAGHKAAFDPRAIPAVVFTDPEVAWCGLTETRAKQEDIPVSVARFPWGASGRASTLGRNDGLTKLIVDPETESVLGMGIVGAGAGELIAEGVLAIEMGALASDLRLTIHPHPTLSETVMESAEAFYGQSTHLYRPRKA